MHILNHISSAQRRFFLNFLFYFITKVASKSIYLQIFENFRKTASLPKKYNKILNSAHAVVMNVEKSWNRISEYFLVSQKSHQTVTSTKKSWSFQTFFQNFDNLTYAFWIFEGKQQWGAPCLYFKHTFLSIGAFFFFLSGC